MAEAEGHRSSADEQTSGVARQPAPMTRSVATVGTRLVRVRFLGAGITPAKRQVEPMTCGRARAVDGVDIARNDGRGGIGALKG